MSHENELALLEARQQELGARLKRHLPEVDESDHNWLVWEYLRQKVPGFSPLVLRQFLRARYQRIPVGIREFIEGKRFLNQPISESGVYPKIVEGLERLFAGGYSEVVLAGSIGWGKTTFGTIGVAYDLYKVSCLIDPAKTYGMKTGSNITFVNVSVDKRQAHNVFFTDLYNLIKNSWYFNHVFPYDKSLKTEIRFPHNVRCYPVAASEQAALGVGVFCAFIDEVNFMEVVERSKRSVRGAKSLYDQAEAVFNKLSYRMRSRMNLFGRLPGHIYASSSARYPDDFTERLQKRAREEATKSIHDMLFLSHALWETIPDGKISKETFRVEVGDENNSTRILRGDETDVNEANVLNVPIDFRTPFERDPELAVRDLGGRSTLAIKPFIGQRAKIRRMFELGKEAGMEHPFTQFTVTLQNEDPGVERLLADRLHWVLEPELNELGRPKFINGQQVMKKVLFPALYHAHFDLAKTGDAAGLVIAHNIGARKVPRFDSRTLHDVEELKPIIRVDLALQVVKPCGSGREIDIPRMRAIIYQLQRSYGMTFGKVTFDTFGSQESVKTMHDEGFDSDILSVDTDNTPYDMLRTAIYDERVLCYEMPILKRELGQLERGDKRIDHPATAGASKDVADCLAACVYHCEESWRAGESSRGLFQLGMVERPGELSPELQTKRDVISAKIDAGQPLSSAEEDDLLFGDLEKL